MSSGGGSITANDLTVTTTGASSAPIATDRGGGTITVTGGSYSSSGSGSPAVYSTGAIIVTGATLAATGSEAVVIEGSNSVTLDDTTASGSKLRGVMLYQSFSGDASGSSSSYAQTGGSLSQKEGPLFYVTNATGTIVLSGVKLTASSGTLLQASADKWGTSGSNGGAANLTAESQELVGDVVTDAISSVTLTLHKSSTLAGAVNNANTATSVSVSLDASSTWTVTADSYLTTLSDDAGISGSTINNIIGNGHTVHYVASANTGFNGKTYQLSGGGQLAPI
jgi:hypothetical protein